MGRDKGRQGTTVGRHQTTLEAAFAEIDRYADIFASRGHSPDYLELIVVDEAGEIMRRPSAQ